ncbi:Carbohydrate sulfotransferase 10-like [Oopsacas minuta]|uniref:Carbohydrate sulfotransferase n=1 Tax=Oopsacas minuta TaxID=111878 RepID=A0AAV7KLU4_9METZ|nr:Carbohydrate sulfotransferase 10-like [Oopsacas minuta]
MEKLFIKLSWREISFLCILLLGFLSTIIFLSKLDCQYGQIFKEMDKTTFRIESSYQHVKNKTEEDDGSWIAYGEHWNENILVVKSHNDESVTFTDEYRMEMLSKGLHPLNLKYNHLRDRFDRVDKLCNVFRTQSNGVYNFLRDGINVVRSSDKYQLLHCAVLKASSSSWLVTFRELEGMEKEERPYPKLIKRVCNYTNAKLNGQRYQTYTKMLIVRNPFHRLLSGYLDKFTRALAYGERYVDAIIISNYLSNLTTESITQMKQELKGGKRKLLNALNNDTIRQIRRLDAEFGKTGVTFLEFLNYIVSYVRENGLKGLDCHWAPHSITCDPCAIRYDIIVKFESLLEDSNTILEYVQRDHPEHNVTFHIHGQASSVDNCNEAFRDIPQHVRRSLYEIYKQDFVLFDYDYRDEDENNNFC